MSWLSSIFTALVTATVGAAVSWYLADLSIRWYRISSFEGGSAYYVVLLALCGLVAGLVIGLVISRVNATSAHPSVVMALLYSTIVMLSAAGAVGGTARVLADIPPTIDGESLMLHIEARWPMTRAESPANTPGTAYLDLGAATLVRTPAAKRGALWKEDAQKIDGRWIVSGAAPMFTSRGTPVIDIVLNEQERVSFTLPPLSHPTLGDSAWTVWYPTEGNGGALRTSGVTYRYRVQKASAPVRTEHIGPFAVSAVVSYFKSVGTEGISTIDFYGSFRIAFHDKPFSTHAANTETGALSLVSAVALLPGTQPLLLAAVNGAWTLLSDEHGSLRAQHVAEVRDTPPAELTNDPKRMAETREPRDPRGRVDRTTYARSHLLLFDHAVLNVDTREVFTFTAQSSASIISNVPPLGVSPDGQSFVRFVKGSVDSVGEYPPLLGVTDFIRDIVYEVPIDRARMRYGTLDELNADWLAYHFRWKRNANGIERLEARTDFVPIHYRGVISTDANGLSIYRFASGGQPVRQVLVEFLKSEFHATGDTANAEAHAFVLNIGRDTIDVETPGDKNSYVRVLLHTVGPRNDLVSRIGNAFNAALATGRYDHAFAQR